MLVPQGSDKRSDALSGACRRIVALVRQGWDKRGSESLVVQRWVGKLLKTVVLCAEISIFVSRTPSGGARPRLRLRENVRKKTDGQGKREGGVRYQAVRQRRARGEALRVDGEDIGHRDGHQEGTERQNPKIRIMEYMSQEGYDKLVAELRELEAQVPKVKDAIAEARAQGDLSENYEYRAAKREQAKLLSRIRFKQRVLEFARVIDTKRLKADTVGLLTKVEMTNLNTQARMAYTLVSPHESNLQEMKLSIKSPIGQALVGKKVGDVVEVKVPVGTLKLRIDDIQL